MKKLIFMIMAFISLMSFTSCRSVTPDAGTESVLVMKPWIWGHGGVDETPVTTGREYVALSTYSVDFNIQPVTYTEEFTNLIPSDNTPLSFSVYPKMQVKSGKTPGLLKDFGVDWYKNNFEAPFRTAVRDLSGMYKMFDLANKREISSLLEKSLYNKAVRIIDSVGLTPYITVHPVSIGAITPPDEVLSETRLTAAQTQSQLTQDARAKSELNRKQAEVNKALADRAYMISMNMTTSEYLHLRQLEIEKEKVELLKDNKNATIIFGGLPVTYPVK
jgi:regulator of protease activity HflC (stomatin/prohibitin superfamily)